MNLNRGIQGRVHALCPYCRGHSKIRFTVLPLQFQHCSRYGLHFRTSTPEESTAIIIVNQTYDKNPF